MNVCFRRNIEEEEEEEELEEKSKSQHTQTLIQCKPKMDDKDFINLLKEKIAQDFRKVQEENAAEMTAAEESAKSNTQG